MLKEPAPPEGSIRGELVKAWEHLESSIFVLHIRQATWGSISDANTQPFSRSYAGHDWLVGHSGSLKLPQLEAVADPRFEPVGLDRHGDHLLPAPGLARRERRAQPGRRRPPGAPGLVRRAQRPREPDHRAHRRKHETSVVVYADKHDEGNIYLWQVTPPYDRLVFGDADLEVDLTKRGTKSRKGVLVCSDPLASSTPVPATWEKLAPGSLVVLRQGAVRARSDAAVPDAEVSQVVPRHVARPARADVRRLDVRHRTLYRYQKPVEKSTHLFRLCPVHDRLQAVLFHETTLSVEGQHRDYEDVFGNQAKRVLLDTPFSELCIEARSRVELYDTDPLSFRPLRARSTIPLVWMPWQGHMLQPFLLPPELLLETQLMELV